MNCDELLAILAKNQLCEPTEQGLRIATDCYYPSFDRVAVFVSQRGDWFHVNDGGEAARNAFIHGRDDQAFDASLKRSCSRYALKPVGGMLTAEVESVEWLYPAILAVANGAAHAAAETSARVSERKVNELRTKIHDTLIEIVPSHTIATEYRYRGSSGRLWPIDFAVTEVAAPLLLKAITPDINSINSNYTTYGDIADIGQDEISRFSVFEAELKPEDRSLMLQVAELVPLVSLDQNARAALGR